MKPVESRPFLELLRSPSSSRAEPLPATEETASPVPTAHTLHARSGRTLTLHEAARGGEDFLHISSPEGKVELSIRFTADGPVLSFDALQLDLKSAGSVNLDCQQLNLRGRQGVALQSGGELSVRSQENMHIDGKNVLINCDRPYHAPVPHEHDGSAGCCHKPER